MLVRGAMTVLALAVSLAWGSAQAGTERFQGSVFEAPEGWSPPPNPKPSLWQAVRKYGDGRGRSSGALIQITSPIPRSQGGLQTNFNQIVNSTADLGRERPTMHGEGETVNGHRMLYDSRCCGRMGEASVGTDTVGIDDGERVWLLRLVRINLRGDDRQAADADFEALVRSFRPRESDSAFELRPAQGDGGLEGIFTHLNTGIRPNAFGGTDFYAESEVLNFEPGGLYAEAIPSGETSLADYCRQKPRECGTYRVRGNQVEWRSVENDYGTIKRRTEPLRREGSILRIGETEHRMVEPMAPDTRLQGVWRYFWASSGSGAFSSGSVAVEKRLLLTRDGRFQRTGFSGATSTNEMGGSRTGVTAGSNRPVETGRYRLEGYRLVLTGDDGRRETLSIFRPDQGSDGLLIIDGNNYLKQDK
ncbi:hypothetical protein IAI18_02345 [Acetobacteraceae bacterium H6797]|nr:hypothetical protein [Acetobacteraceae bacterium H6797]